MHFIKAWNVLLVTRFYSSDAGSWEVTIATGKKSYLFASQYYDRSAEAKRGEGRHRSQGSGEGDTAPTHLLPAPQSPAQTPTTDGDAGSGSSNPEQKVWSGPRSSLPAGSTGHDQM